MANNGNLHMSKAGRQDEFYTTLDLIEKELKNYRQHFKGKTVLCNCDDPFESNFFKYFAMNFNFLGLKKLFATCYVSSPVMYTQLSLFDDMEQTFSRPADPNKKPYKVEITEVTDENGDGAFDLEDIKQLLKSKKNVCKILKGDGDFRSDECMELLKEADIVVTNPPFSLFIEYFQSLIDNNKDFIILGNINNITYTNVMPLYKAGKVWLGANSGHFWFRVPDYYEEKPTDFKIDENGKKWRRMGNICWFTNLDYDSRYDEIPLYKQYTPEEYPKYENFDAIYVKECKDIPCDYYGYMGVPITFCAKHNPKQFEYIGIDKEVTEKGERFKRKLADGTIKTEYARVVIRRKEQPQ